MERNSDRHIREKASKTTNISGTKRSRKRAATVHIENLTGCRLCLYSSDRKTELRVFKAHHRAARLRNKEVKKADIYGLPATPRVVATGIWHLPKGDKGDHLVYIVNEEVGEWARINMLLHPGTFIGPEYSHESTVYGLGEAVVGFTRFIVYKA